MMSWYIGCGCGVAGKRMWRMTSTPVEEESVTTIDLYTGCASLGVSIVGGIDTPLVTILALTLMNGDNISSVYLFVYLPHTFVPYNV